MARKIKSTTYIRFFDQETAHAYQTGEFDRLERGFNRFWSRCVDAYHGRSKGYIEAIAYVALVWALDYWGKPEQRDGVVEPEEKRMNRAAIYALYRHELGMIDEAKLIDTNKIAWVFRKHHYKPSTIAKWDALLHPDWYADELVETEQP